MNEKEINKAYNDMMQSLRNAWDKARQIRDSHAESDAMGIMAWQVVMDDIKKVVNSIENTP